MFKRITRRCTVKRCRNPCTIDQSDVQSILKLRDDGWSVIRISNHIGMDAIKVARVMVHPELYTNKRPRGPTIEEARAILKASIDPKLSAYQIAERTGLKISLSTVKRFLAIKKVIVNLKFNKDCDKYGDLKKRWSAIYDAEQDSEIEEVVDDDEMETGSEDDAMETMSDGEMEAASQDDSALAA